MKLKKHLDKKYGKGKERKEFEKEYQRFKKRAMEKEVKKSKSGGNYIVYKIGESLFLASAIVLMCLGDFQYGIKSVFVSLFCSVLWRLEKLLKEGDDEQDSKNDNL